MMNSFFHYHIARSVCEGFHAVLLAPFEQEGAHLLFVLGRTRTTGYLVEIFPDYCWLKVFDRHIICVLGLAYLRKYTNFCYLCE